RVRKAFFDRLERADNQVLAKRFEFGPSQLEVQMFWTRGIRRQKGQVHLGFQGARQLYFGLFGGLLQALQDHFVLGDVDALVFLEFRNEIIDDLLVDIVPAQVGVTVGRDHLDDVFAYFKNRNIEGAAAEIVNRN